MYANVNQKACIQCGLCPSICPEVFSLDDGAPAHAITEPVPEDCRLTAQEAADSCPTGAIEIRGSSGSLPKHTAAGQSPAAVKSALTVLRRSIGTIYEPTHIT